MLKNVLSLEICIDLNCAQESIESYFIERGFGKSPKVSVKKKKKFETHLYTYLSSFNNNELKFNETNSNFKKEKKINDNNKKYLRVLDIRKNEYYGDVLMFLNERAPLRIKVKSKKAELFYFSKTDAIEISTFYPNIWKRIIQKSLFNMKQIKNLTKKILIYFSKLNGIFINEEMCKDINTNTPISIDNNIISLKAENTYKNLKSKNNEEESEISNDVNNIPTVIYEEGNETLESILTNKNLNYEVVESNKSCSKNSNIINKKLSTNCGTSKKNIKNISNIKKNQNLQSKFDTDLEQITPKENNEINTKN